MKRTAIAINCTNDGCEIMNNGKPITCETFGETAEGVKCWGEPQDDGKGNWYSLHKTNNGVWYFILEGC